MCLLKTACTRLVVGLVHCEISWKYLISTLRSVSYVLRYDKTYVSSYFINIFQLGIALYKVMG